MHRRFSKWFFRAQTQSKFLAGVDWKDAKDDLKVFWAWRGPGRGLQEQIIIILGFAFAFALASLSVRWCMPRFAGDEWWEQIKEKMCPWRGRFAHEREDTHEREDVPMKGEDVPMKGKMWLVKGSWERTGRLGKQAPRLADLPTLILSPVVTS